MADFHFIEDYERHVRALMKQYPLAQAMDLAVGGSWATIQEIELAILRHVGLHDRMGVIDLGCGSGRLAQGLGNSGLKLDYLGIDIVQPLLDYARKISPPNYRFVMNRSLSLPAKDRSFDMMCAFSVFTHLLPQETFIYLEDAHRVLRNGGRVVLSFLELEVPGHWTIFQSTVDSLKANVQAPLNAFLTRDVIKLFASHLGYDVEPHGSPHF